MVAGNGTIIITCTLQFGSILSDFRAALRVARPNEPMPVGRWGTDANDATVSTTIVYSCNVACDSFPPHVVTFGPVNRFDGLFETREAVCRQERLDGGQVLGAERCGVARLGDLTAECSRRHAVIDTWHGDLLPNNNMRCKLSNYTGKPKLHVIDTCQKNPL